MSMTTASSRPGYRRAALTAAAGGAGAIVGFLLSRVTELWNPTTETAVVLTQSVWYASVVGAIGVAIAIAGYALDVRRPSAVMIGVGSAVLLAVSFVAGVLAQLAFQGILDEASLNECFSDYRRTLDDPALTLCVGESFRLPRLVGWSVAGVLGGLGIGSFLMSKQRTLNAVSGGLVAGALGGLLFDLVQSIIGISRLWPSQLVAVVAIGALIGFAVGLIEAIRLSAWVEVLSGELKGRTIALSERVSRIGSDRSLEVPVIGDRQAESYHARIVVDARSAAIEPVGGMVQVNGKPGPARMVDGDVFTVGTTSMRYRTRASSSGEEFATRGDTEQSHTRSTGSSMTPPPVAAPPAAVRPRPRLDLKPRE
jgi:hypothetical protein